MKAKPRKAGKRKLSHQLKTLMSVRKPLPPATRVIPDGSRIAARRRLKRVDPSTD